MKRKIKKILIVILIICLIIYIVTGVLKTFHTHYIVDFDDTKIVLDRNDKEELLKVIKLPSTNIDTVKITKIEYEKPFRHEGKFCIFYDGEMYEHICLVTYLCEEYEIVTKIVEKYYK